MQSNVIQVIYADMKSWADIGQSCRLAKILPIESADMYRVFENNAETRVYYGKMPTAHFVCKSCWSLAALLKVISNIFKYNLDYNGTSFILMVGDFEVSNKSAVDACYEMIIRLNELKML